MPVRSSNWALPIALIISSLVHLCALLIPQRWPTFLRDQRAADAEPIEVTYLTKAATRPRPIPERLALAAIQPLTQATRPPVQTFRIEPPAPQEPPAAPKPAPPSPALPASPAVQEPQAEIPPATQDIANALAAYSEQLRQALQIHFDTQAATVNRAGTVTLLVQVSRDGQLLQVAILPSDSTSDRALQQVTLTIMARVTQLPAFPEGLDYPSLHFKIPVVFESG